MRREDFLNKVADIVTKDREQQYGSAEDNFKNIADMWSIIKGVKFEPYEVALFMIALKLVREANKHKEDNWIDICGYSVCGSELCDDVKVVKK